MLFGTCVDLTEVIANAMAEQAEKEFAEYQRALDEERAVIGANLTTIRHENEAGRDKIRADNFIYSLVENGTSLTAAVFLALVGLVLRRKCGKGSQTQDRIAIDVENKAEAPPATPEQMRVERR